MSSPHPFGLFDHDIAAKLKRDAKELAIVSVVALLLSTIGSALAVFSFLTKSAIWSWL